MKRIARIFATITATAVLSLSVATTVHANPGHASQEQVTNQQDIDAYQPDPTKYQPDPTKYQPDPTKYQPDPTKYQPDPTKYQPDPTKNDSRPVPAAPTMDAPAPPDIP